MTSLSIVFYYPGLEEICDIAIQVLEQKALCQQDPDQDEEDEPLEDQAEYDSVLISSAGDLVAAIAAALGPDFGQAFQTFFPLIAKFYVSTTRPHRRELKLILRSLGQEAIIE